MKSGYFLILTASLVLAGCSSGLLGGKSHVQQANNVPVGNQLIVPPDLTLPAPGSSNASYAAEAPAVGAVDDGFDEPIESAPPKAVRPAAATQDVYAQYGISKLKPNGTKKEDWELRAELKAAVLKKKRESNPGYGTVFNIGGLFSDD